MWHSTQRKEIDERVSTKKAQLPVEVVGGDKGLSLGSYLTQLLYSRVRRLTRMETGCRAEEECRGGSHATRVFVFNLSWDTNVKPRHIASHPIPSHHIPSRHIPSHSITSHHITSRPITSHHIPSRHIPSHHVPSRHIT